MSVSLLLSFTFIKISLMKNISYKLCTRTSPSLSKKLHEMLTLLSRYIVPVNFNEFTPCSYPYLILLHFSIDIVRSSHQARRKINAESRRHCRR